jgi:hypothetical protein
MEVENGVLTAGLGLIEENGDEKTPQANGKLRICVSFTLVT